jgi:cyclase
MTNPTLIPIGDGVWAHIAHDVGPNFTNMGVVAEDDGLTVIDTGMVRSQWEPFVDAVKALERPVRRVIMTSADIWHVGGSKAFTQAAVYATRPVSDLLDQPLAIDAYKTFMPQFADEFDELGATGTRSVTHLVDEPAVLTPRIEVIPAPGHTPGDLIVLVPDSDVCFTGSMVTTHTAPLGFQSDPRVWVETLHAIRDFASVVVPGRGSIGTKTDIDVMIDYLNACIACQGDVTALASGPWDSWSERRFDAVNVECAELRRQASTALPATMARWITPAPSESVDASER